MDPIQPIGRQDRTVQPVDLTPLRPLDRDEERRRERERERRRPPEKRPEGGADGIDVRA